MYYDGDDESSESDCVPGSFSFDEKGIEVIATLNCDLKEVIF